MGKKDKLHKITLRTQVALNDADRIARGGELAANELEYVRVTEQKAKAMADFKEELDRIGSLIAHLSNVISEGHEIREVEVRVVPDLERKVIEYRRLESEDIVDERAMTVDEIEAAEQGDLFSLDLSPPAAEEGEGASAH